MWFLIRKFTALLFRTQTLRMNSLLGDSLLIQYARVRNNGAVFCFVVYMLTVNNPLVILSVAKNPYALSRHVVVIAGRCTNLLPIFYLLKVI